MIREDMRFDTRTLPHRLRRKELTSEDVETWLSELPDEAEEAVETEVTFSRSFESRHRSEARKG